MTLEAQVPKPDTNVSATFLLLVLAFALTGMGLVGDDLGRVGVFAFVGVGWIISLCLHEWGHAITASRGGDNSVAERGYLTLNPLRYTNLLWSIGVPLLILAAGGIGFPGGAVYVRNDLLRGPLWRMAVSAAGPAMNLVCLIALGLCFRFGGFDSSAPSALGAGIALLALLQATAVLLNLLPIPGLDGFGILQAWLPPSVSAGLAPFRGLVMMAFVVIIFSAPQYLDWLWDTAYAVCSFFGINENAVRQGFHMFRFWENGF